MATASSREAGPSGAGGGGVPSPSSLPPSKRDKRRTLLSDRLTELSTSFKGDRDQHYANQVHALRQDYAAIASADISGRDMRMLGDGAEEIDMIVTGRIYTGGDGAGSNMRNGGIGSGAAPGSIQPGSYYAGFVQEINEKMEERDVGLAILHRQYHSKLTALKAQHERNLHHAREEHLNLAVTMKQRLINRLYNAKKKLAADKEQLDVADTHALHHHPNQFSIGSASAGLLCSPGRDDRSRDGGMGDIFGSGGAIGSRRKLRQRRNEVDDLMLGNGGLFDVFTGVGRGGEINSNGDSKPQRRKARTGRHSRRTGGGLGEDEPEEMDIYGNGVSTPAVNGGNGHAGVGAAQLASLLHRQQLGGVEEAVNKPVWGIEKLFTEKELQMAGNLAALATVRYFSSRKGKRAKGSNKDGGTGGSGADTDDEGGSEGPRTPPLNAEDAPAPVGLGLTDWANTPLAPTPATVFASTFTPVLGPGHHNTRSHNASTTSYPTPSRMALNSATHNHLMHIQPPPTLQQLSFMTPSGSGYGSAAWQALGVPASHFSAGSGSVVNTAKAAALCAPAPAPARPEDAERDLEFIRRGVEVGVEVQQVEEGVEEVLVEMVKVGEGWGVGSGLFKDVEEDGDEMVGGPEEEKEVVGLGLILEDEGAAFGLAEEANVVTGEDGTDSQATIPDVVEPEVPAAIKNRGPRSPVPGLAPVSPSAVSATPRGHKRSASSSIPPDAGYLGKKARVAGSDSGIEYGQEQEKKEGEGANEGDGQVERHKSV